MAKNFELRGVKTEQGKVGKALVQATLTVVAVEEYWKNPDKEPKEIEVVLDLTDEKAAQVFGGIFLNKSIGGTSGTLNQRIDRAVKNNAIIFIADRYLPS